MCICLEVWSATFSVTELYCFQNQGTISITTVKMTGRKRFPTCTTSRAWYNFLLVSLTPFGLFQNSTWWCKSRLYCNYGSEFTTICVKTDASATTSLVIGFGSFHRLLWRAGCIRCFAVALARKYAFWSSQIICHHHLFLKVNHKFHSRNCVNWQIRCRLWCAVFRGTLISRTILYDFSWIY